MPMPHRTQMQLIKKRLVGKDDAERIRELRKILTELPGYRNGPYADIRKWVNTQIEASRVRKKVVTATRLRCAGGRGTHRAVGRRTRANRRCSGAVVDPDQDGDMSLRRSSLCRR